MKCTSSKKTVGLFPPYLPSKPEDQACYKPTAGIGLERNLVLIIRLLISVGLDFVCCISHFCLGGAKVSRRERGSVPTQSYSIHL